MYARPYWRIAAGKSEELTERSPWRSMVYPGNVEVRIGTDNRCCDAAPPDSIKVFLAFGKGDTFRVIEAGWDRAPNANVSVAEDSSAEYLCEFG